MISPANPIRAQYIIQECNGCPVELNVAQNEFRTTYAVPKDAFISNKKDGIPGLSGLWLSILLRLEHKVPFEQGFFCIGPN